jgi:hypothetical protein
MFKIQITICLIAMLVCASPSLAVDPSDDPAGDKASSVLPYKQLLDGLDASDPKSIETALLQYHQSISEGAQEQRDNAFLAFRQFFYEVIESLNKQFWVDQNNPDISVENIKERIIKEMGDYRKWLTVFESEGYFSVFENENVLLDTFYHNISAPIHRFLVLRSIEMREVFQVDAALRIDLIEIGRRYIQWEDYLQQYPDSPLVEDAREFHRIYLSSLLTGTGNSRILDVGETETKQEHHRRVSFAYRQLMEKFPNSRLASLLTRYLPWLEQGQFIVTKEVETFLRQEGVTLMYASRRLFR